jgi:hypothetical protein
VQGVMSQFVFGGQLHSPSIWGTNLWSIFFHWYSRPKQKSKLFYYAWQRVQINSFLPTLYIHVYILQCQNVKKTKHPNSIEKRRNKCSSNRFYVYPPSHPHTTVTVSYLCSNNVKNKFKYTSMKNSNICVSV